MGLLMAQHGSCVLLDATSVAGTDDLLLNRAVDASWLDLLPVASEIRRKHLDLAAPDHDSGLRLLAAPAKPLTANLAPLISALADKLERVIVDGDAGLSEANRRWIPAVDAVLLVTTLDPPALRSASRIAEWLKAETRPVGLIINQWTRSHPADPGSLANSLGLPLLGVLPLDPAAAFAWVNFGHPGAGAKGEGFAQAIAEVGRRVMDWMDTGTVDSLDADGS